MATRALIVLVMGLALVPGVRVGDPSAASPEAVLQAWALDSMTRLSRGAAPGTSTEVAISAARGETESFQVAVHATNRLTGGDLDVSALTGPGGATIPQSSISLFREHYVRVRRHSPGNSGPVLRHRWFPDALLPFRDPLTGGAPDPKAQHAATPYVVAPGRTQPFWVDVAVPRSAVPGDYTATWTVTSNQGSASGTVSLTVRGFALPEVPAAGSSFGMYHGRHRAAKERLLLGASIQPLQVPARRQTRLVPSGLSMTDAAFWSGADIRSCTMDPPPTTRAVRHRIRQFDSRLRVYNYTADEISDCPGLTDRLKTYSRRLHRAGVEQLVTMVPRWNLLDDGTGRPAVDIWVLLPQQARRLDPRLRQAVLDRGGEFWSYQALTQGKHTPSWQIDFPPANYRVLPGFLNTATGFTGILYWTVDYWRPNPWQDVVYADSGCCFPGDGSLVYPGAPAGVPSAIPSMRLAWIRDGLDDYAYADLLRRSGGDVAATISPAARSWRSWTQSPAVLAAVREQIAGQLGG